MSCCWRYGLGSGIYYEDFYMEVGLWESSLVTMVGMGRGDVIRLLKQTQQRYLLATQGSSGAGMLLHLFPALGQMALPLSRGRCCDLEEAALSWTA